MNTSLEYPRYFTPEEANSQLDLVRMVIGQLKIVADQARSRIALQRVAPGPEAWLEVELERLRLLADGLFSELEAEGIFVKSLSPALVLFPALRNGVRVFLCWRESDDTVESWFPLHSSYLARSSVTREQARWTWEN